MSSIVAAYELAMSSAAVDALQRLLADNPSASVSDLHALVSEHPNLGGVTLGQLVGGSAPAKAAPPARTAKPKAAKKRPTAKRQPAKAATGAQAPSAPVAAPAPAQQSAPRDKWDTRTAEGREALDRAVMEALAVFGGVSVSAEAIRARLDVSPDQLRRSLNRHIEAGKVSFSGQARGTRYSIE
jgi:hypothetical protein